MRVYRIENEMGLGMYCLYPFLADAPYRPAPSNDGLEKKYGSAWGVGWHFGFADLEQLRAWLRPTRDDEDDIPGKLHRKGCAIAVYDAPDEFVRVGWHQVVFYRAKARLIERLNIRDVLCERQAEAA